MTGFYITGSRLQPGVTRVSDGEPGDRANWVLTQADHFLKNPTLDVVDGRARVRAGTTVSFGAVDYHTVAADSWRSRTDLRRNGTAGGVGARRRRPDLPSLLRRFEVRRVTVHG